MPRWHGGINLQGGFWWPLPPLGDNRATRRQHQCVLDAPVLWGARDAPPPFMPRWRGGINDHDGFRWPLLPFAAKIGAFPTHFLFGERATRSHRPRPNGAVGLMTMTGFGGLCCPSARSARRAVEIGASWMHPFFMERVTRCYHSCQNSAVGSTTLTGGSGLCCPSARSAQWATLTLTLS